MPEKKPAADLVLGQPDFISNTVGSCGNCQLNLSVLLQPQSLAFDSSGALYVADGFARVLYYPTPGTGFPASKLLGVIPALTAGQQPRPIPNEYSLGNNLINAPLAVFTNGTVVFVADTIANRSASAESDIGGGSSRTVNAGSRSPFRTSVMRT